MENYFNFITIPNENPQSSTPTTITNFYSYFVYLCLNKIFVILAQFSSLVSLTGQIERK